MVSVLDSGSGGAGSSPSLSHSTVFLGKTLNSYKTSPPRHTYGTGKIINKI